MNTNCANTFAGRAGLPGRSASRHGISLLWLILLIPVLLGFSALAIDLGVMHVWRTRCQTAADAAARAAAQALIEVPGDLVYSEGQAVHYAEANLPDEGTVLDLDDVVFGHWDSGTRTFTPSESAPNAVQVIVRRSEVNDNPLPMLFAPIWGRTEGNVSARAIAAFETGGPQFRFIIDDEMINSGYQPIKDIARVMGKLPEDIIQDKDYDGWIDLPVGWRAWLPTGQLGDEAFFDRTRWGAHFPFKPDSKYTTLDFLLEGTNMQIIMGTKRLADMSWKITDPPPHPELKDKKVLDPVPGIEPISSNQAIHDLVDPDAIWISPVYKGDVGMAEKDPSKYGSPWANLLGERRSGLMAFKILEARNRSGSYLPEVYIEIINGNTIDMRQVAEGDGVTTGTSEPKPPVIVR